MTLREYIEFKLIDTEKVDITIYHLIVIVIIVIATWLILRLVKKLLSRQVKYKRIDIDY